MSGKHLCQSRLSATYISSNRYMHIILFYFRLFILFSPGLPFIRLSSFFIRTSFALPSSFPHPSSVLPSPFPLFSLCFLPVILFTLSPSFQLLSPRHSRLDRESLSFPLFSPCLSNWLLPIFSNVHPLHHSLCSPRHSSSRLRHSRLSSPSFPARPGIPCHPEPVLLVILSASEGSSPTDFSIIISKHTKI